jgi:hypothetical protein
VGRKDGAIDTLTVVVAARDGPRSTMTTRVQTTAHTIASARPADSMTLCARLEMRANSDDGMCDDVMRTDKDSQDVNLS